jgi:hypothetical protein
MPKPEFLLLIKSSTLLSDGAMGTMLHARGVSFGKCFDELNPTNPVRANLQQSHATILRVLPVPVASQPFR